MRKQKNYDNVFKQTILKLHENGKSLKELSREYLVSTQSIGAWKKASKKIEKAGVKEKTKIRNFLKKVIDKYREWCYCMVVQNNKRKTKQRRLPTSSLCFFVFYLKNLFNAMGG